MGDHIHARAPRLLTALVIATVLLGGSVAGAAPVSADPDAEHAIIPLMVPFTHSVNVDDALELAKAEGESLLGYAYDNGMVSGEVMVTPELTLEAFAADFVTRFETELRLTGLVVARDVETDQILSLNPTPITTSKRDFKADPIELSLLEPYAASEPATQIDTGIAHRWGTGEWRPEKIEASVRRDEIEDGHITFTQKVIWGEQASPIDLPTSGAIKVEDLPEIPFESAKFGMEFGISAYDRSLDNLDPLCGGPFDFFAQKNAFGVSFSWEVITFGTVVSDLGKYRDWIIDDVCSRSDYAIGIRYPEHIPEDISGNHRVTIRITVPEGLATENEIGADVQLVDDMACLTSPGVPPPPLGACMGFDQITADGGSSRRVLNPDRLWWAPDRCWVSANFGLSVIPSQSCGQENKDHQGVAISEIDIDGKVGNSGKYTFRASVTGGPNYVGSSSGHINFPYLDDPNRQIITGDLSDLRIWTEDTSSSMTEIPVDFENWQLVIPVDGSSITLTNTDSEGTAKIGDGYLETLDDLARHGTISFRVGNSGVNYLTLDNLDDQVRDYLPLYGAVGEEYSGGDFFSSLDWDIPSSSYRLGANLWEMGQPITEPEPGRPSIPMNEYTDVTEDNERYHFYEAPISSMKLHVPDGPTIVGTPITCVDDPGVGAYCSDTNNTISIVRKSSFDEDLQIWKLQPGWNVVIDPHEFVFTTPLDRYEFYDLLPEGAVLETTFDGGRVLKVNLFERNGASRPAG